VKQYQVANNWSMISKGDVEFASFSGNGKQGTGREMFVFKCFIREWRELWSSLFVVLS
jgi:hypothetical protein